MYKNKHECKNNHLQSGPPTYQLISRGPVITHRIHVWYIHLHLVDFHGFHVGKYSIPMDPQWVIPLLGILFTPVTHFFVHPFFPCILLAISRGTRQNCHGTLGEVSRVAHGSHGWTGRCVTLWIVTPCSILDDEVVTC